MDLGVRDQNYIVLGGSRGMGFETARILAAEGARVALVSRTDTQLREAAATIAVESGVEPIVVAADAASPGDIDRAFGEIIGQMGPPRGLLVTSGLTTRNGTLLEVGDDDWTANFQDVLMGHVRACRAALPAMIANGGGQIVTTAAYSARAAKRFLFPYAAQKAAVINFTKNLAKTYGADGIRANCVCPGAIETVRVKAAIEAVMAETGLDSRAAAAEVMNNRFGMPVALGRSGRAGEVAELMAFLLSERAGYLTGAIVNIDGGTDF